MKELTTDVPYRLQTKQFTVPRKAHAEQQVRDTFQTPRYATELLLPFIPKHITHIWECAAGKGRISRILEEAGYSVFKSDLKEGDGIISYNFIDGIPRMDIGQNFSIITNPPFSIKDLFIEKCFEYGVPFALLINADYSGKQIDWIKRGCEKIIPNRRVDYITPFILENVHEGEVWEIICDAVDFNRSSSDLKRYKETYPKFWTGHLQTYEHVHNYSRIDDVPDELLFKYSASQFHSMWLTHGFNIGRTETFVDLPIINKKERIK